MWLPIAMGGLSMLQAQQQQKNQQRAQAANMNANAAAMEYSPWTGMGKQMIQAQPSGGFGDVLAKGIQGGMMGQMFNQQLNKNSGANNPWVDLLMEERQSPWGGMTKNMSTPSMYGSGTRYA